MKKIFLLLYIYFTGFILQAQNITGTWEGSLSVQGNEIPIVFHISKDSTKKLIASFDSPSQHAFGLACNDVIVKDDSVILMMDILKGKYTGLLSADKKQMNGTWFQGGGALPLNVNKTSETAVVKELKRPQTPKPPYAYISEDVEYYNADKSLKYGATITYPKADANANPATYPSVILITGSGQQDRDENIFGHKSFAVIADYLTKKGFLVLRVDDRGIGKSTGIFSAATTADFAKDVEASLDFLETQPQVNKNKLGLIGHSEGGMIAPMVADARSEIKFIVLLAGPGIPITQLMREQVDAVSASQGLNPEIVKASGEIFSMFTAEVNKNEDSVTTHNNLRTKLIAFAQNSDTATRSALGLNDLSGIDKNITNELKTFSSPWYKYFLGFNPQPYLEKLHCKVLALNGGKDVQVLPTSNLAGIRASLKKSRSPKYDVIEIPGLNHLFQTCIKCSPDEYGDLEETFSPKALQIMGDWLDKNAK